MQKTASINIYNASAGAGKTFALVRNYLVILFQSKNEYQYRHILAITFTNKAVAEMKMRIVNNLQEFSNPEILHTPTAMFTEIQQATKLSPEELQVKAQKLLKNIIQDFASFDVVTIDNFTHRIIRTFARDLKIPQNFEVELNTLDVLEEAVDNLIDRAGTDPLITPILIDYALEKTDSDKSWDISRDFYDVSRLLLSENDRTHLQKLNGKTLGDFRALKELLKGRMEELQVHIRKTARQTLDFIADQGLLPSNFKGKYLPNALEKISSGNFVLNLNSAWVANMGQEPLYAKTQKEHIKTIMDQVSPQIAAWFFELKDSILKIGLLEDLLKKLTPLSVLQAISEEVEKIKKEKNLVLISDFNDLIHKNIAGQPTPFIYERLGERFHHYFIDEFQDTSVLQWENLVPLIDDAVSGQKAEGLPGSLMVVGDPKQAIYRWRGGEAEQFIDLSGEKNPFQNKDKEVIHLPRNYRSHKQIIEFNNSFFSHIADDLSDREHQRIYTEGNRQKTTEKPGGYVSLSFVDAQTKEEALPYYLEATHNRVQRSLLDGFKLSDLCILVRKNDEGIAIAQYLQEQNIPVVSNESLLLRQAPQVLFIVNIFRFIQQPEADEISIKILEFIAEEQLGLEDPHDFFISHLSHSGQELFDHIIPEKPVFSLEYGAQLPLYDAAEYIIQHFGLNEQGGAYLQFFLDAVYEFSQKEETAIPGFLNWWDRKKDKLSISNPPGTDALQVMTVHKAKGLEFPVVIYPFAESDIYPRSDNMNWYQTDPSEFLGFETLLLSQKKDLLDINEKTAYLYNYKREQQQLDNYNVLYVALTRSIEQLHIISRVSSSGGSSERDPKTFADLFISYLEEKGLRNEQESFYEFGTPEKVSVSEKSEEKTISLKLICSDKREHNLEIVTQAERLWDIERQEAIATGTIIHDLMSGITIADDVGRALRMAETKGMLTVESSADLKKELSNLISALEGEGFFNPQNKIYNERDIAYEGELLRPDRVEIDSEGNAYLLDYKTGSKNPAHIKQVKEYADALGQMGFRVKKIIIAYLNGADPLFLVNP